MYALLVIVVALGGIPQSSAFLIRGVVVDSSGSALSGATVAVDLPGTAPVMTAPDGRFEMSIPASGPRRVTVTLAGFQPAGGTIDAAASQEGSAGRPLRITLFPRAFAEQVSVTATRGSERLEGAAPVSIVTQTDLDLAASPAVDD